MRVWNLSTLDKLLTVENVVAVMSMIDHNKRIKLWRRLMVGVDEKRFKIIESSYPEEAKQVEGLATHYVEVYFNPSWHLLYQALYHAGETAAMDKMLEIDCDRDVFSHEYRKRQKGGLLVYYLAM